MPIRARLDHHVDRVVRKHGVEVEGHELESGYRLDDSTFPNDGRIEKGMTSHVSIGGSVSEGPEESSSHIAAVVPSLSRVAETNERRGNGKNCRQTSA